MAWRSSSGNEDHGIDLAPMLDFTINLLIFFIITTSFIKEPGVTVAKPTAATAEHRESGNLLIALRANGEIWLDRQAIDLRELRSLIERLRVERPDDTVVIVADRAADTGLVAKVMDQVRLGGIREISIGADPGGGA